MGNVTAMLRNFSSSNNNSKWEISYDSGNYFTVLFCANGNCKDNEGYVSIIFSKFESIRHPLIQFILYNETRCYVSVVDVAGNKRFTQSIVFNTYQLAHLEEDYQIVLERYLKRETLLNDPAELLPEDCLTICVDVDNRRDIDYRFEFDVPNNKKTETCIFLDTDFGRELCRVSEVFRRASDIPMMESRTRKVPIPEMEQFYFRLIRGIFYESEVSFASMAEICKLHRVADKYDIQLVIETCKQFVNALLLTTGDPKFWEHEAEIIQEILERAEIYGDDELKETVHTYLESKENFGRNYYTLGKHLKEKLHTEWKCKVYEIRNCSGCFFRMKRRVIEPEFQFYQ